MKLIKKSIVIFCIALLCANLLPAGETIKAYAAEAAMLSDSNLTTGINVKSELSVINSTKDATYTFTSSDKSVVSIESTGSTAVLTSLKTGKVTITCKETLGDTTTTVGTCEVTVNEAVAYCEYGDAFTMPMYYSQSTDYEYIIPIFNVLYQNPEAKYTYKTSSKDLTYTRNDNIYSTTETLSAKKPGTYTVTIKETYKKKTKTIATYKVTIKKVSVASKFQVPLNSSVYLFDTIILDASTNKWYFISCDAFDVSVKSKNSIILSKKDKYDVSILAGIKKGTCTLKVYESSSQFGTDKTFLGTCKITVADLPVKKIIPDEKTIETYVGEEYVGIWWETVPEFPSYEIKDCKITSSDPSVAVAELSEYGVWYLKSLKKGRTKLTITYPNKVSATIGVIVLPEK